MRLKASAVFCVSLLQAAGCNQVLGSNVRIDRCGVCGGNGNSCKHETGQYMTQWNETGNEQFDNVNICYLPAGRSV